MDKNKVFLRHYKFCCAANTTPYCLQLVKSIAELVENENSNFGLFFKALIENKWNFQKFQGSFKKKICETFFALSVASFAKV